MYCRSWPPLISEVLYHLNKGLTCDFIQLSNPEQRNHPLSVKKKNCTANSLCLKEEVVHEETEEQQSQDPVDRVDVDDDQADVKEPAAHVSEAKSIQCKTSTAKVPTSPCHRRLSLVSWSETDKVTVCTQSDLTQSILMLVQIFVWSCFFNEQCPPII